MTFLSQLELRSRHLGVVRDLADPAELHRTIMRAFPQRDEPSPRAALGVLFREEVEAGRTVVIVQSQVRPDWDKLVDGYLVGAQTKDIAAALAAIADGRELRFRLVANPTRKIARDGSRHSRRVELLTDDARHGWLAARAERHGFRLNGTGPHDGVRIDRVVSAGVPWGDAGRADITVKPVRYEGRIIVTDAERLIDAIRQGIGPAKAYGCGLLSVAPR